MWTLDFQRGAQRLRPLLRRPDHGAQPESAATEGADRSTPSRWCSATWVPAVAYAPTSGDRCFARMDLMVDGLYAIGNTAANTFGKYVSGCGCHHRLRASSTVTSRHSTPPAGSPEPACGFSPVGCPPSGRHRRLQRRFVVPLRTSTPAPGTEHPQDRSLRTSPRRHRDRLIICSRQFALSRVVLLRPLQRQPGARPRRLLTGPTDLGRGGLLELLRVGRRAR